MKLAIMSDIHGRGDKLVECLAKIDELRKTEEILVIMLGDYIDRGDKNLFVLDTLMDYKKKYPDTVLLRGNHEEFILGSLAFNRLSDSAYIKALHVSKNKIFDIWTIHQNGGDNTYNEIKEKYNLSDKELISDDGNEKLQHYIDFIANEMIYSMSVETSAGDILLFSHAPINRIYYHDLADYNERGTNYDTVWNHQIVKTDGDFINVCGHIHLAQDHEARVEEAKIILCATEPDISIVFIDESKPIEWPAKEPE